MTPFFPHCIARWAGAPLPVMVVLAAGRPSEIAGYQYVNIDDGWQLTTRGPDGNLRYDPKKFPSGMKALGDYIHSKGLKYGSYTSAGVKTCMRYEGSYHFEDRDTRRFASWGVDFVKVDWCCTLSKHLGDRNCPRNEDPDYALTGQEEIYQRWRAAFAKVDRPMWKKMDLGQYTGAFESDICMVKMSPTPDSDKD